MTWIVDCEYYFKMKDRYGSPHISEIPLIIVSQHD